MHSSVFTIGCGLQTSLRQLGSVALKHFLDKLQNLANLERMQGWIMGTKIGRNRSPEKQRLPGGGRTMGTEGLRTLYLGFRWSTAGMFPHEIGPGF